MNYRHAYHAGNFADVLKHVALVAALRLLARKPSPCFVLDTHAGRGHYPLDAAETQRAGEYREGVLRVLESPDVGDAPPAVADWLGLVRAYGVVDGRLRAYPGSPRLALAVLRADDRVAACELEPRELARLREALHGEPRVAVHERDGWEALRGLVPPREKRGLVLIDPPYEQADEFERLAEALAGAVQRWPTGVYAAWYPVKAGGAHARFLARLQASGVRRQLVVELCVRPEDSPAGLNGAGLLFVNPPWRLDAALEPALPWLHARLAAGGRGGWRLRWQVPE